MILRFTIFYVTYRSVGEGFPVGVLWDALAGVVGSNPMPLRPGRLLPSTSRTTQTAPASTHAQIHLREARLRASWQFHAAVGATARAA